MTHRGFDSNPLILTALGLALALWVLSPFAPGTGLAGAAAADEAEQEYSAFNGEITYRVHCINCHGESGKGDGKLADLLRVRPTDLTRLSKKNDGVFPADDVAQAIDGREEVQGHGMREMPVWGDAFQWPDQEDPEAVAQRKIGELVAYIESIQAE